MPQVKTGGTLINIDGIASDITSAPSDANSAVGETQYVQWVNTRLAVYNKADGALLRGRFPATLWSPAPPARPAPMPAA